MPSPCDVAYGLHYRFDPEGIAVSISGDRGDELIDILNLNASHAISYRRKWIAQMREFLQLAGHLAEPSRTKLLERWFGYPEDMPDLRRFRPRSNSRPAGRMQTSFLRRQRGELPSIY